MRAKSHRVVLSVIFDRPCTKAHAIREVRDSIHGDFYPTVIRDGDPGRFKVRSVVGLPGAPSLTGKLRRAGLR